MSENSEVSSPGSEVLRGHGETRDGKQVQWLGPFSVPCSYVHPPFVQLQGAFDRACQIHNNDDRDLRGNRRQQSPWRESGSICGLKGPPRPLNMVLIKHEVGLAWEERFADIRWRRWRLANHLEAYAFGMYPETSELQRERRIVAPGSFSYATRTVLLPITGDLSVERRCTTLLRSDVHGRWLDFLFLDEEPRTDLWILCVEA